MTAWRVGSHYGIHVYEGDRPVATFHREEDARRCVEAVEARARAGAQLATVRAALAALTEAVGRGDEYGLPEAYRAARDALGEPT